MHIVDNDMHIVDNDMHIVHNDMHIVQKIKKDMHIVVTICISLTSICISLPDDMHIIAYHSVYHTKSTHQTVQIRTTHVHITLVRSQPQR